MNYFLSLCRWWCCFTLLFSLVANAQAESWDTFSDTWIATDELGRRVPTATEVGAPRAGKFVGMFYFLWLGEHGNAGPFDISKILRQDPNAMSNPQSPLWGQEGAPHHWGEPLFDYYVSRDEWFLRKHAQMLSDAGVDAVFFDVTNQLTYPRSYLALCRVWQQIRREGGKTPQIAFLTPFWEPARVTRTLYDDFYKPGLYSDLWFRWEGKPLILANPDLIQADKLQSQTREPAALNAGTTLGQSFRADKPFNAVGGEFPTWNTKDSAVTLSLFQDDPNGKLLARQRFTGVVDNATLFLPSTPLPAGNYYLELSQPEGQVGWWSYTSEAYAAGGAFSNGVPSSGDRSLHIHYLGQDKATLLSPEAQISPQEAQKQAEETVAKIKDFFTFRKPQPDYFTGPRGPGEWGWLEVFPQHIFYKTPGVPEQMTVGVAQNAVDGKLSVLSHPRSHGRSFHDGQEPASAMQDFSGRNFAEQWQRALEVDPSFIFVTGWNEWIAGRFGRTAPFYGVGAVNFVDEFNEEYSRDIEPMKGGHGDDYYYQLVSNVRHFKGARALPLASAPQTIKIGSHFAQWQKVQPEFRDDRFDTTHRDSPGWGRDSRYINNTGRNDFVVLKVARDAQNLYFYARTAQPISKAASQWMQLFIDTDCNAQTGWHGFDFAINRVQPKGNWTQLERYKNDRWQPVGVAHFAVKGNEMQLAVPRAALDLAASQFQFDFKWMDNTSAQSDILNLYVNGDTAPNGRFKYRYSSPVGRVS